MEKEEEGGGRGWGKRTGWRGKGEDATNPPFLAVHSHSG